MNQQKMEQALRDIAEILRDDAQDRQMRIASAAENAGTLGKVARIVNGTLADIDAGRKASK